MERQTHSRVVIVFLLYFLTGNTELLAKLKIHFDRQDNYFSKNTTYFATSSYKNKRSEQDIFITHQVHRK